METNRSNKKTRKYNGSRKNTKAANNPVTQETVLDGEIIDLRTIEPSESTKRSQSASKIPRIRKPTHEDIAHRAYAIWNDRGRPEGTEFENWLMAERELLNERH